MKRKSLDAHGRYRTKETILEMYDALAESQRPGQPCQTCLDPPPAELRCRHPPRQANHPAS